MQRKNNWFQRTMLTGRLNTNFFQSFSSLSESIISSVSWHALSLTWGTLAKWMIFLAELTFYRVELFILPTAIYCLEMRTFSCSNLDWFTLPLCTCKIQRFLVSLIRSMFYSFKKKNNNNRKWNLSEIDSKWGFSGYLNIFVVFKNETATNII